MDGYLDFRMHRVYHETVSGVDRLFFPEINHDDFIIDLSNPCKLLLEELLLFKVQVHALLYIRQFKDFLYGMVDAVIDQLHHQIVIRDTESAETSQAGARIHQEIQQHPVSRIQNFVLCKIRTVSLIDSFHDLFGHPREDLFTTIVIVYDSCR